MLKNVILNYITKMSHLRTSLTFITTTVPKITPVNEGLLTKFYSIRKEQERKMQTMQAIGVDNSYRYRIKSIFKLCASYQKSPSFDEHFQGTTDRKSVV